MPLAVIEFIQPANSSLQLGDLVYYSPTTTVANSIIETTTTSSMVKLGVVVGSVDTTLNVDGTPSTSFGTLQFVDPVSGQYFVNVLYDSLTALPSTDDYIMFEKDKRVNSSSLIGSYADVFLSNDATSKIELFSLGSEVTESSK